MTRKKTVPNRVDELLDELIGDNPTPESILGESGLLKQLTTVSKITSPYAIFYGLVA